jgi:hypothetical protein
MGVRGGTEALLIVSARECSATRSVCFTPGCHHYLLVVPTGCLDAVVAKTVFALARLRVPVSRMPVYKTQLCIDIYMFLLLVYLVGLLFGTLAHCNAQHMKASSSILKQSAIRVYLTNTLFVLV